MYVAEQDIRRYPKQLICSESAKDGIVKIIRFNGQRDEANGIAKIIEWLINIQSIEPSKIIILIRSDKNKRFSKVIFESLFQRHIPVRIMSDPLEPLETDEGRIFLSLLHLIVNEYDHLAWKVLLQIRKNGIGDIIFNSIYEFARNKGITYTQALFEIRDNPSVINKGGDKVKNEINEIKKIVIPYNIHNIDDLNKFINDFAKQIISNEKTRADVINIFLKVINQVENIDLNSLLRAINITFSEEEQGPEEGNVAIMTMHQAKGLNADAVFIVAAEDEYIPGKAITAEQTDDERRLLYVSLTRAKHYLYITHCKRRTREQKHSGRTSGNPVRNLTRFLSGGPIDTIPADQYFLEITMMKN